MELQTIKPELILEANPGAIIFMIIFVAPDGRSYGWNGNGFGITAIDEASGFFDLKGVERSKAVQQYYSASTDAKTLPFVTGKLELVALPLFSE